jgi:hypothetical protein
MRRSVRVFGLAAAVYVVVTAALTWPLVIRPGRIVPSDLGDPALNMYLLAWNARVLPLTERWWNLPQFHPIEGVTAYSEHLLGLSLITTPIFTISGNPVLAYNAAFFLSFVLCGLSAHVLCYVLTRNHAASFVAGLAFGFAPYRMSQLAHIQVLSAYWMPIALAGLHLYFQRRQARWIVMFAAAWLLQALSCGYFLFYLSALVGLWLLWFAAGRERWMDVAKVLGAWALAALALAPIAYGYLKYQRVYGLRRWPDEIQAFSADIASVLKAPADLRFWGWLDVVDRPESALFPGATIVALTLVGVALAWSTAARMGASRLRAPRVLMTLALIFAAVAATPLLFGDWKLEVFGVTLLSVSTPQKPFSVAVLLVAVALALHPAIRTAWRTRSSLAFYTLSTVAMWLFSLGPAPTLMNEPVLYKAPYAWLLMLPGVDGVRVPARFWVLGTLCLAIAGALALIRIFDRWPKLRPWLPALACALIVLESWPTHIRFEPPPAARPAHAPAVARLELPMSPPLDALVLYRAIEHRRPVLNGYSGYFAPHYWALQYLLNERDPRVLGRISALGAIEVVVNHEFDGDRRWRRFVADHPGAEVAHESAEYTAYRVPRGTAIRDTPVVEGEPLPIASIATSLYQNLVGLMRDGDRVTRWHTGGPQSRGTELVVDLGTERDVRGVVLDLAGYVADFPRALVIETSSDRASWKRAWRGRTALLALSAALVNPLEIPLAFPFEGRPARYVRLRQTGRDGVYYWSIAELRVYGK